MRIGHELVEGGPLRLSPRNALIPVLGDQLEGSVRGVVPELIELEVEGLILGATSGVRSPRSRASCIKSRTSTRSESISPKPSVR